MNFSTVKHIRIPEGDVTEITVNGRQIWHGLPSGYTAIASISGSGGAYIATDLHLTDEDIVKASVHLTGACNVFGCFTDSSASDNFSFYTGSSNSSKLYARMDGLLDSSGRSVLNEDIFVCMDKTGLWINDMQKASFSSVEPFTASAPFYIGWLDNSSSPKLVGSIYELEVVGKFHGIPARRDSDGVCGLYDLTSRSFFSSNTSTEFVGGDPI